MRGIRAEARFGWRVAVVAFALGTAVVASRAIGGETPTVAADADCLLESGPARSVVAVLDGETIRLDDGVEVRLVGAMAPRLPAADAAGASWPPAEEARRMLEGLVGGRSVEIAFHGRRTDRYGRLLAHVFTGEGKERIWVQGEMLASGQARAYVLDGSRACFAEMLAHEAQGRTSGLGLWRHAAFGVRTAARPRELLRYRSTYQLVAGTVTDVVETKGRLYINFGRDWREDFTAGVDAATVRANRAWAESLKAAKGRRVVVRGWVERRNGPFVEISHPRQVEIDGEGAAAAAAAMDGGGVGNAEAEAEARERGARTRKTRPVRKAPGAFDL